MAIAKRNVLRFAAIFKKLGLGPNNQAKVLESQIIGKLAAAKSTVFPFGRSRPAVDTQRNAGRNPGAATACGSEPGRGAASWVRL